MSVRQGVQKRLKVVPVLSAEIGDKFCPGHLMLSLKTSIFIIFLT
jgi:hypothetical protein